MDGILKLATLAAGTVLATGASGGAGLPDWAEREIAAAVRRYEAWKGTNEVVTFVYANDVHSYVDGRSDPPNYADPKMHIPIFVACADRVNADFFVDLGDEDLEWAARRGEAALDRRISDIRTLYAACFPKRPVLFCVGAGGAAADRRYRYDRNGIEKCKRW